MSRSIVVVPVLMALLTAVAWVGSAGAEGAKDPPQAELTRAVVESRLGNLERLIHASLAAERVSASGDVKANRMRDEAKSLYQQARNAFADGDLAGASELLDQATAKMFLAIRMVGGTSQ